MVFSLTANAQYFKLSGNFTYANIPARPGNQVFDISPDGKMGIALRNDRTTNNPVVTTFHPLFGDQFDTKTFGFGPLEVRMAKVGNNLRAVVLTSQGGPRRIYLFDISATGQLTEIASTDLTTSVGDAGSNMVLSGQAGLGWVSVDTNASQSDELVCFSLETGAIVKRSSLVGRTESLILNEGTSRRNIAYRSDSTFRVVNVLDAANPVETANVALVRNAEFSGQIIDEVAFSADGRYAFVANQLHNFAAIDLNTKQVVATLDTNFRFLRIESFEDNQKRLLAIFSDQTGTVNSTALLLVDATNPSQLTILKNVSPAPADRFKFSNDGSRLFAASPSRLVALNLPDFTTIWEQPTPNNPIRQNGLRVYGPDNEIIGAWWFHDGTGEGALIGSFPSTPPPSVTLSDSVTVNETAGGVNATFTVTLSATTTHRVTVNYTTVDVTAEDDHDYTATTGSIAIQPGTTSGSVSIPILDDVLDEDDETLTFKVAPNLGTIANAERTITIVDNDAPPALSIGDAAAVVEGHSFPGPLSSFPVTLSAPSGRAITVTWAAAVNTAAVNDFLVTFGSFTLFPGQTTHEIIIPVISDTYAEGDETFFINLNKPATAGLVDGQGVGTILDDDAPVLATEQNSQRAIAFDAVTFVREPLSITNQNYFGTDKRTRLAIFSNNLEVSPGLQVTVQAVDTQQVVHQLPVETVVAVPGIIIGRNQPIVTQIIVRLPQGITIAGDLEISVTARGRTSNKVMVGVKP